MWKSAQSSRTLHSICSLKPWSFPPNMHVLLPASWCWVLSASSSHSKTPQRWEHGTELPKAPGTGGVSGLDGGSVPEHGRARGCCIMPGLRETLPRHLVWETALTELIYLFFIFLKNTSCCVRWGNEQEESRRPMLHKELHF